MALTASHLDALILSGCTAEQIVALVKADMAEREANLVVRRVKDAERQRRHRERHAESRGVTVTECDVTERVSLDKEKSPTPPKEINPIPPSRDARARARHPLPANWHPSPLKQNGEAGQIVALWPAGRMERELSKFKDHALQNRRLCACWDAAWRNWIKRTGDFERPNHERPDNPTAIALQRVAGAFGGRG